MGKTFRMTVRDMQTLLEDFPSDWEIVFQMTPDTIENNPIVMIDIVDDVEFNYNRSFKGDYRVEDKSITRLYMNVREPK